MAYILNYKPENTNHGSLIFFNLNRNAKVTCTYVAIKEIIRHQQEYQHQCFREEKPSSLVDDRWGAKSMNHLY
jgi:hypothetical protein